MGLLVDTVPVSVTLKFGWPGQVQIDSRTAAPSRSCPSFDPKPIKLHVTSAKVQPLENIMFHTEKAFSCELCDKRFRFCSNLSEHRSVHTALKPYVCKFCGKSSHLKATHTKHILNHHNYIPISKDSVIIQKAKKSKQ
ncbi:hypothetical protein QR680_015245 [Steinernema hermaphroditum]|uniref:C2H2-type domain-containing protein n=1 Tax=Steinernema hermaphroditum TaxID=289476 RepID=A0AA39LK97_9BILA|nr:hypothetical protein QR680_015245 [Steinernema hermaphroditum]